MKNLHLLAFATIFFLFSSSLVFGQLDLGGSNGPITGYGTPNWVAKFNGTGNYTIGVSSIFDNGNVGIGTTSPLSKLSIGGGLAIGTYAGLNAAPTNGMIVSGTVGIGTSTPNTMYKLDVNGVVSIGNLYVGSIADKLQISNYPAGSNYLINAPYVNDYSLTAYTLTIRAGDNYTSGPPPKMGSIGLDGGELNLSGGDSYNGNGGNIYVRGGNGFENGNVILGYDGVNEYSNVGIGTTNPTEKLTVNGTIKAKEIIVNTGWSDFVFEDNYEIKSLDDIEAYINSNKHLPGIPSSKEVEESGVSLGEMQSKLLQKVEELTLYIIQQNKDIKSLKTENSKLQELLSGKDK